MSNDYHELIPLGAATTPYELVTTDHVSTTTFDGQEILKGDPEGRTLLADRAIRDSAHLLRPGHLEQVRSILDDPEASANDRFFRSEQPPTANSNAIWAGASLSTRRT